jgi:uncharacterized repeat protein (TIGR02543 family)
VDDITAGEGTVVTKPAADPAKDGYTFIGWFSAETGGTLYAWPYTLSADVTMHAQWWDDSQGTFTTCTITFDSHNGLVVPSITAPNGTQVTKPADPAKDGYTFTGWFSAETGGTLYAWPYTLSADVTMHAQWQDNSLTQCTVSFDSNGGGEVAEQQIAEGGYAFQPDPPSKDGFGFAGWYSDPSLYDWYYWDFTTQIWYDIILYAKWGNVFYTVSFDSNGGSPVVEQQIAEGGYAVQPDPPSKDGFGFAGWYADPSYAGSPYNFNDTAITVNITLYAKWNAPISSGQDAEDFGVGRFINGSFDISNRAEWDEAVAAVNAGGDGSAGTPKNYVFNITGDFTLPGLPNVDYYSPPYTFTASYIALSLRGAGGGTNPIVSLDSEGRMFMLGGHRAGDEARSQIIILRDLTLRGYEDNDYPMIWFENGDDHILRLKNGAVITGNSYPYGGVSGIYIRNTGSIYDNDDSFTMIMEDDATVTGIAGGAISIGLGKLVMKDNASITNNTTVASYSDEPIGYAVEAGDIIMEGNATVANNLSETETVDATNITMRDYAAIHDNETVGKYGGGGVGIFGTLLMEDHAAIYNNAVNVVIEGTAPIHEQLTVSGGGVITGTFGGDVIMRGYASVYNNAVNVTVKSTGRSVSALFLEGGGISGPTVMEDDAKVYGNTLEVVFSGNTADPRFIGLFGAGVNGSVTMSGRAEVYNNTTVYPSAADTSVQQNVGGVFSGSYYADGADGIHVIGGYDAALSGNAAIHHNDGTGLFCGSLTMEGDASVHDNAGVGIYSQKGAVSVMRGNAAVYNNGAGGIFAIGDTSALDFENHSVTMEDNTKVYNNTGRGVQALYGVSFTMQGNSKVYGNGNTSGGDSGGVFIGYVSVFTMKDSSEISGNGNSGSAGAGGVAVRASSFTMRNNAKITGNAASQGGGIYGLSYSTDGNTSINIRDNAVISGNTSGAGGGVLLYDMSGGRVSFNMGGGVIYGNSEGPLNSNTDTSSHGAALYNNNAQARYGTFNGDTFTPVGNLTTRDTTIRVVNGVLQ